MTIQNQPVRVRPVISVSGMARIVNMSRSRFYDHIRRGVFPSPEYSPTTKRPYYTAEKQEAILEARQTGIGCNGEYVIFYERTTAHTAPIDKTTSTTNDVGDLVARLADVGLTVTPDQVRQALVACFPAGTAGQDAATVLRTINRHLRRPSSAR